MSNCPLCNLILIQTIPLEKGFCEPDTNCPNIIKLPNGKKASHFRISPLNETTRFYTLPYRITNYNLTNTSQISIKAQYKTGKHYFKTLAITHLIKPNDEEKLIARIKLILLLS